MTTSTTHAKETNRSKRCRNIVKQFQKGAAKFTPPLKFHPDEGINWEYVLLMDNTFEELDLSQKMRDYIVRKFGLKTNPTRLCIICIDWKLENSPLSLPQYIKHHVFDL